MRESHAPLSGASREQLFPLVHPKKFARVARLLWPEKTAAELALRAGVSERAAKHWLAGKRRPSSQALLAVLREIV